MGFCVCSACNRHVKECSATCPFCGAAFVAAKATCAEPSARMSVAAAIGTAVVLSGCSSPMSEPLYAGPACDPGCTEPPGPDATMEAGADGTTEAAGDAAPEEASTDTGTTMDTGTLQDAGADADAQGPADAGTDGQESGPD